MRDFILMRRPLPRRTLIFSHCMLQIGLLLIGGAWLWRHSPAASGLPWQASWPMLALGGGALLLAMALVRLFAELWMAPHHMLARREGFAPGDVMTRAIDRRPAMHDPEQAWISTAKPLDPDEGVVGQARVTQPRQPATAKRQPVTPSQRQEPSL
ncbi:hypothetical protein ACFO0U_09530 [Chromohalobacter sarecensis]|uniref:Uncharacterized protein n=1 Tax=Chromohalobacter sarecensis TaxID=245294 RepID=A0ABV9D305_9GAMM|nr:hypothetical protein [Chromohalobacter sarecensis]MCK0715159.1 hypothetical protein [Chromohalobacter sarecensis]